MAEVRKTSKTKSVEATALKPLGEYGRRELAFAILGLIAAGAIVLTALVAPNIGGVLKLFRARGRSERARVSRVLRNLERRKYIERRSGRYRLTPKGRRVLTEDDVWGMKIAVPAAWDGQWRLVGFDIPARYERARRALRARLRELGFVPYQESLYVFPYDGRREIEACARFYGVSDRVRFISASGLDGEDPLLKRFKLKRPLILRKGTCT